MRSLDTNASEKPTRIASAGPTVSADSASRVPSSPGARDNSQVAPTSGTNPIVTSGKPNLRPLGHHAVGTVRRDTDAAAEHDAVLNRDERLRVVRDARVQRVLVAPESGGVHSVGAGHISVESDDVAASAEPTITGTGHRDRRDRVVVGPTVESLADQQHHRMSQGVDGLRPVERDQSQPPPLIGDHVGKLGVAVIGRSPRDRARRSAS